MNINHTPQKDQLILKYSLKIPSSHCVLCSLQEKTNGKINLFLLFPDDDAIYIRSGLKETWISLRDHVHYELYRKLLLDAIHAKKFQDRCLL